MNLLNNSERPTFVTLEANGSTPFFWLRGDAGFNVPTVHNGENQSLGGGTLSLKWSSDNGASSQVYTDTNGNAATVSAVNQAMPAKLFGWHLCCLTLADATDPYISCIEIYGDFRKA